MRRERSGGAPSGDLGSKRGEVGAKPRDFCLLLLDSADQVGHESRQIQRVQVGRQGRDARGLLQHPHRVRDMLLELLGNKADGHRYRLGALRKLGGGVVILTLRRKPGSNLWVQ